MGEFKGTKKPWRTSKDFREVTTSKIGVLEGSKKICTMASYCKTDDEVEANGKLIAAAPDLLEALNELKKWVLNLEDWRGIDPPIELAIEAIKKATE